MALPALQPHDLAAIDALLSDDDRRRTAEYPGALTTRQPVHTVYVPADRLRGDLVASWGTAARGALKDHAPDPERVAQSVRYAERWLPGVEPVPVFGVTCLYTTTPTEDFVVDRRGPFIIGSACSGHGFKFTPAIGLLLADLATDESSVPRIARFGLSR